jgi:hypothetical protein
VSEKPRDQAGVEFLDPGEVTPLLAGLHDSSAEVRIAMLEALTRLPLAPSDWMRVGAFIAWVLESASPLEERLAVIDIAPWVPLRWVRKLLTRLAVEGGEEEVQARAEAAARTVHTTPERAVSWGSPLHPAWAEGEPPGFTTYSASEMSKVRAELARLLLPFKEHLWGCEYRESPPFRTLNERAMAPVLEQGLAPAAVTLLFEQAADQGTYWMLSNHITGWVQEIQGRFQPDLDGLFTTYWRLAVEKGGFSYFLAEGTESGPRTSCYHIGWTVSRGGLRGLVPGLAGHLSGGDWTERIAAAFMIADAADYVSQPNAPLFGGGSAPDRQVYEPLPGYEEPVPSDQSRPRGKAERPDQRFFLADLEDHPKGQPLKKDNQYTIAFSVGPSSDTAIAERIFPDEILGTADPDVEIFDLTVQLDSDDFTIFSDATRPLRVPRTGRSLGKARFDIAPRHDGDCQLTASVHYKGNFVHQMGLTILVGGDRRSEIDVLTRGRPPDSAAALEPRDISILLEPAAEGGFTCTALGSVGGRVHLPISANELANAVDSAHGAMMRVIECVSAGERVFQTRIDIPGDARDSALRTLARAGAYLFQQLFLHPVAGEDARKVGEWLRRYALDPGLRLTVQVFAYGAPLPWAMLYLGDAAEGAELDWNSFLGMRHVVEQLPLQMSLGTIDNEILSTPRLAVSVNVNTSIDNPARGITMVAGHQKHWRDTAAARAGLTLLSRSTIREVVRALADGHTGDQVVYFYCHALSGGQQNGNAAAIIMGKNDAATVADLHLDARTTIQLPGNPLVFINACESAELSPLFYNGFVPYFMAKGARGVIGTECKIPALFAIEWANAFFDRFLDGAAVGETVLKLRQDFLREQGNPLGLIYAVHCDADTRIAPALVRATMQQ